MIPFTQSLREDRQPRLSSCPVRVERACPQRAEPLHEESQRLIHGAAPTRATGQTRPAHTLAILIVLMWSCACATAADAPAKSIPITKVKRSSPVDFEREILPILKNNCVACHNQTKPKGGLVLETPQTILKGGDAGPSVVPKKPAESLLLKVAAHQDPEMIMPPPDNKVAAVPFKPAELGLLQLWIEQGAKGEVRASTPIVWQAIPSGLHAIYAVALTRDGQFAACGRGNQIFMYHLPTARLVARLNDPQLQRTSNGVASHRDTVNALAFSPDGDVLASGGYREVKLWRREKPVEKFKLPPGCDQIATSDDGKWIAVSSTNGDVHVLDQGGKLKVTAPSRDGRIGALRFFGATNVLIVARGKALELYSIPSGVAVAQGEMPGEITSVCGMGSSRLAVACGDDVIRLVASGTNASAWVIDQEIQSPVPVTLLASSAAVTNQIVAGSPDGSLRIWDTSKATVALEMQLGSSLSALAMRPDGKYFASADGKTAKLWRKGETNAVAELNGEGTAVFRVAEAEREVAFANSEIAYRKSALQTVATNLTTALARQKKATDTNAALGKITAEKQLALTNAVAARDEAEKGILELGTEVGKIMEGLALAEKESTNAIALAKAAKEGPDKSKFEKLLAESAVKSNLLAEARANFEALPAETKAKQKSADEKLSAAKKALNKAEKDLKAAEQAQGLAENELSLSTKAMQKAEASVSNAKNELEKAETNLKVAVRVHESERQKLMKRAEQPVRALAFSPDNRLLVTGHADGSLRTWSADSGTAVATISTSSRSPAAIAMLGNNSLVASFDSEGAAWDMRANWTLTRTIGTGDANSPLADRINALRFKADGRQLFTGGGEPTRGGEIKLWSVPDGLFVRDFQNVHSDSVFALDLSVDGKFLMSGAADRFARIVELASGQVVKTLEGHTHHVLGVAWKRDGRTVITTGADSIAKVWDATTGERRKNIDGFGKEITGAAFIGVSDEAVLSAGDAQVVLVKDNGAKVRSFVGATDYVHATAATPDGDTVVAGGADGILRVWNGKTGKLVTEFGGR